MPITDDNFAGGCVVHRSLVTRGTCNPRIGADATAEFRALVIGRTVMGSELASRARELGAHVTIVTKDDDVMTKALGRVTGGIASRLQEFHGVRVIRERIPVAYIGDEHGTATGLHAAVPRHGPVSDLVELSQTDAHNTATKGSRFPRPVATADRFEQARPQAGTSCPIEPRAVIGHDNEPATLPTTKFNVNLRSTAVPECIRQALLEHITHITDSTSGDHSRIGRDSYLHQCAPRSAHRARELFSRHCCDNRSGGKPFDSIIQSLTSQGR